MLRWALALVVLAQPAFALSCMAPNIANGFNWAADQDAPFAVALGTLHAPERYPPPANAATLKEAGLPVPQAYHAEFQGAFLSANGLEAPVEIGVTVQEICHSAWCGVFPDEGREMVMILAMTDQGLTLEADPCQVSFQYEPADKVQKVLQNCLSKGYCADKQVIALTK